MNSRKTPFASQPSWPEKKSKISTSFVEPVSAEEDAIATGYVCIVTQSWISIFLGVGRSCAVFVDQRSSDEAVFDFGESHVRFLSRTRNQEALVEEKVSIVKERLELRRIEFSTYQQVWQRVGGIETADHQLSNDGIWSQVSRSVKLVNWR